MNDKIEETICPTVPLYNIKPLGKFGLKCGQIINVLYNKVDEVKILLEEIKFDIFAVTETHLRDGIADFEVAIGEQMLFRKDRTGKKQERKTLIKNSQWKSALTSSTATRRASCVTLC